MYLVGSFVLVSLAGCGRGFFQSAEREPWRAEAEIACLKSGAVKESPELVRIDPISGPGACGAQFPLKVAALGEGNSSFGFADDLAAARRYRQRQPRWPMSQRRRPRRPRRSTLFPAAYATAPAGLWRAVERADFADRAGRRTRGGRNRSAARRHAATARPAAALALSWRASLSAARALFRASPQLTRALFGPIPGGRAAAAARAGAR